MRKALALSIAFVALGSIAGTAAVFGLRPPAKPETIRPVWAEAKWPMPLDQWGSGKMYVCMPADCGTKIDIFVRPKIGFCNCATGVSDDAELERVADTELVSNNIRPRGPGRLVKVGWMEGRSRSYQASGKETGTRLLSVAYNDECDVVVAVATLGDTDSAEIEPAVLAFLNSTPMVLWAKKELGLEFIRRDW